MNQIDSHHHFWRYNPGEYAWIDDSMSILKQDFLPDDLKKNLNDAQISGTVAVQARQSNTETEWLLDIATQHDFIYGVVGWVPLISDTVVNDLERYAAHPKLKAVRHVLHDEEDDRYMLRDDFNRGIRQLRHFDLAYDILIFAKHLSYTLAFVDQHPDQTFVVDHIAKPVIQQDQFDQQWDRNIRELAKREYVYCKLSGVVTEIRDVEWSRETMLAYVDTVLEAFGPKRIMFGSDWPVCRLRLEYADWVATVRGLISVLSEDEQNYIMSKTAVEAYKLD